MTRYVSNVRADIARWHDAGVIDAATAEALSRDIEIHARSRFDLGRAVAALASVSMAAAILLFVAANWEDIPRLVRAGLIFMVIAGGYVGGALLRARGHNVLSEAAWLIGAAAFGGGIALIAQMYHLSGDETQAVLLWCGGTALAAAAFRSDPLTSAAVLLAAAWMLMVFAEHGDGDPVHFYYFLMAAALWAISLWTASPNARHLLILSLVIYAIAFFIDSEQRAALVLLTVASSTVFFAARFYPKHAEGVSGLGRGLMIHGFIGFLTGMAILQIDTADESLFLPAVCITFAGIVAALAMGGRDSHTLRWLAYTAFGLELAYVYAQLVGTMLGTAGFLLAAGLILGAVAWFIFRMERRLSDPAAKA